MVIPVLFLVPCDYFSYILVAFRLEGVKVNPVMKETLKGLNQSREGLMVTFQDHAKYCREQEKEKQKAKPAHSPH